MKGRTTAEDRANAFSASLAHAKEVVAQSRNTRNVSVLRRLLLRAQKRKAAK